MRRADCNERFQGDPRRRDSSLVLIPGNMGTYFAPVMVESFGVHAPIGIASYALWEGLTASAHGCIFLCCACVVISAM